MSKKEEKNEIPEDLTYEAAYSELEEILNQLKNEEVSIDRLEEVVSRAAVLSKFCSEKLRNTEAKVQSIIEKLDL